MEENQDLKEKKFLDLGSIVLLKKATKPLMIIGHNINNKDYCVTPYPEGITFPKMIFLIDHKDIQKIIFKGFHSPTGEKYLELLKDHNKNDKYSRIGFVNITTHDYYLPIGTVIFLKNSKNSYIIAGYIENKNDEENKVSYLGLIYPVGIDNFKNIAVFNNKNIDSIRYIGYKDEKYKKFSKILKTK